MNKQLGEMNAKELGKLFPIILSPHNPDWTELFCDEKERLITAIGAGHVASIHHIGSTSIPGIYAKPTIDILLELHEDIEDQVIMNAFKAIGYEYSPQPNNPPPHMMFMKGYSIKGFEGQTFHLHVRYSGEWDELYFRDYLRLHPELAKEYETLKIKLKSQYEFDRESYTSSKTEFVKRITKLARNELGK